MKPFHKIFLLALITFSVLQVKAQSTDDVQLLIKQGTALHDQQKYAEAIEKYQQALKLDPQNITAQYEMAFTLAASGRAKEAIPYLEKVTASNKEPGAYDLLGSIYDDQKDYDKAIAYYKQGITAFPQYQRLHFNLALSYLRQNKNPEAETAIIDAIKLDPKHASSQNIYAVIMLRENKRVPAVLALCNFLILEPQSQRSVAAFNNLKTILQAGVSPGDNKTISVVIPKDNGGDSAAQTLNFSLPLIVASATMGDKKNRPLVDILQEELKDVFMEAGELGEKKQNKDFFWNFYVDYFYKLAKTNNMPAFTRLVSLTGNQQENVQWFKDHTSEVQALSDWVQANSHSF